MSKAGKTAPASKGAAAAAPKEPPKEPPKEQPQAAAAPPPPPVASVCNLNAEEMEGTYTTVFIGFTVK